ncbi:MAG: thermonuclease family protein [Patescibacteria group bacterium]|nr:thermonuclease family protein [Patescibacteria group bacterium]
MDTPETVHPKKEVECYGPQASAYTKETLADQYIKLEYDETQTQRDRYDRLLVYVIHQGQNFNQNLIEQGYAKEYTYGKAYKYQ